MYTDTALHPRSRATHWLRRTAALAAGGLVGALSVVVPASPAHAAYPAGCVETGPTTVVCSWTSGKHTLPLPAGVASVHVVAIGARGATANGTSWVDAGRGARVEGDLAVTPGSTLVAVVGASGGNGAGGSNVGGAPFPGCGWGGGASDVRTGDALADRVVVAGGGGGPGCDFSGAIVTRGGDAEAAGVDGTGEPLGGGGGQAGTQVSGGSGGAGGDHLLGSAGSGGNGGFGTGGAATGYAALGESSGGGGGGGWYGGGAGGSGGTNGFGTFGSGGGGGGGSSLVPAGWASPTISPASPRVEISFSTAPLPTIVFTSDEPPAGVVGQAYNHAYSASGDDGITYAVTDGSLPPGLALAPNGELAGTPTTAGSFSFSVTATGSSGATATRTDSVTVADKPPVVADLAIAMSATPNPVRAGNTVSYQVTIANHGPDGALGLQMDDLLPSGTQFTSLAAPTGWSCTTPPVGSHGTVSCAAGSLATDDTVVITIDAKVVVTAKTTITNTATVTASSTDPHAANNTASASTSVQGGRPKK